MNPGPLTRRDFLKLMGLAAGGALLAACGEAGSGGSQVRIMVDSWALAYAPFKEMAKQYNALYPGTEIKIEASPGGWMTKVVGQMRADKLQWCAAGVMSTFADLAAWVQLGLIQPLDSYIAASTVEEASAFLSDMLPPVKADESLDGKLFGLPFSVENITYQWNTEWYGRAGITQSPQSWQDLYDYAKAVTQVLAAEGSEKTYALAFDLGHLNRNLGALFFSACDQPYTDDGWLRWDSEEMRAALAFMRKLSRDGLTPPNCGEGLEIVDMWTRGRLLGLYSPSSRGVWAQKSIGFDKVVTAQIPTGDGKPHSGSTFWCNSVSLLNKAPLPQAAVDFLVFACGPQNLEWQKTIIQAGTSPAFETVYTNLLHTDPVLAPYRWMTELRDQISISAPSPKNYYYQVQNEAWTRHWPEFLKDSSPMTEDELITRVLSSCEEIHAQVLQSVPTVVP
jgi:ABC-type glycerol-3-phosphate transport system substrate-binding protein